MLLPLVLVEASLCGAVEAACLRLVPLFPWFRMHKEETPPPTGRSSNCSRSWLKPPDVMVRLSPSGRELQGERDERRERERKAAGRRRKEEKEATECSVEDRK